MRPCCFESPARSILSFFHSLISLDNPGKKSRPTARTPEQTTGYRQTDCRGTLGINGRYFGRQRWPEQPATACLVGFAGNAAPFSGCTTGLASTVGAFRLLIAYGLCIGQPVPLPGWLAEREMNGRARTLLTGMINRVIHIIAFLGRSRMLNLSDKPARVLNGLMLSAAGLSMMIPVPIISFDDVLPALAIVLLSWGLRLRDGLMLLVGYLVTLAAVASVILLWWGGAHVASELLSLTGLASNR